MRETISIAYLRIIPAFRKCFYFHYICLSYDFCTFKCDKYCSTFPMSLIYTCSLKITLSNKYWIQTMRICYRYCYNFAALVILLWAPRAVHWQHIAGRCTLYRNIPAHFIAPAVGTYARILVKSLQVYDHLDSTVMILTNPFFTFSRVYCIQRPRFGKVCFSYLLCQPSGTIWMYGNCSSAVE